MTKFADGEVRGVMGGINFKTRNKPRQPRCLRQPRSSFMARLSERLLPIVRTFTTKLNDGRPVKTGIMFSAVLRFLLSDGATLTPDVPERVSCVARRCAVLTGMGLQPEQHGIFEGYEAITVSGSVISAEGSSTTKGDLGSRWRKVYEL